MNNTRTNSLQSDQMFEIAYSSNTSGNKIQKTNFYSSKGSMASISKKTAKENKAFLLKSMNNIKANGLKNAHCLKVSVPGII